MMKDVAIKLPDGSIVEKGMSIYILKEMDVSDYSGTHSIPTHSGRSRAKIEKHKVVGINPKTNSRSFTIQSKSGCEQTFTVRGTCIREQLFSKRSEAEKEAQGIDKVDLLKINREIAAWTNTKRILLKQKTH